MKLNIASLFLTLCVFQVAYSSEDTVEEEIVVEGSESQTNTQAIQSTPVVIKPKRPQPEMVVVNPVRRVGTSIAKEDTEPCGGIPKQDADTLTNIGTTINTIWEIRTPIAQGNCTVSMSTALDVNFTSLKPIGKDVQYTKDFTFSCGRQQGFEFQQFELPEDYACDRCTLQVKWSTPEGNVYTCSDLMILGNKMENCLAKCHNGGACVNGRCICTKNFGGEFCEEDLNEESNWGWIVLIILLLAGLGVGGYLLYKKNNDTWMAPKSEQHQLENNFIENDPQPINVN